MRVNEETFTPEMIVTMSFPMEPIKENDLELNKAEFIYSEFEKAWKEYQNERR